MRPPGLGGIVFYSCPEAISPNKPRPNQPPQVDTTCAVSTWLKARPEQTLGLASQVIPSIMVRFPKRIGPDLIKGSNDMT